MTLPLSLPARFLRKPKIAIACTLVVFALLLLYLRSEETAALLPLASWSSKSPFYSSWGVIGSRYYSYQTPSFFPPLNITRTDNEEDENAKKAKGDKKIPDYCSNFPSHKLNSIQVVLKGGSAEAEKNAAHLASVTSCIHNLIAFSDLDQKIGKQQYIDVLAGLPASYAIDNPDFEHYETQKDEFRKFGKVDYSGEGWRLDRFKFLPMVEKAYELNPKADWYVFIEADVYYFWDTLFRLLHQLDPSEMHYMGSPSPGANGIFFAYGGAGIVMSKGLVSRFVSGRKPSIQYQDSVKKDCCGDAVLGYAIHDKTGVRLQALYPTFAGDDLQGLRVNAEWWCVPLLALHRLTPELLKSLWAWERTRIFNENAFTVSSTLEYNFRDVNDRAIREDWENLSMDLQPEGDKSHSSVEACRMACLNNPKCMQFSHTPNSCKFSQFVMGGHGVVDEEQRTSGWDMAKLTALGYAPKKDFSCKDPTWLKPEVR